MSTDYSPSGDGWLPGPPASDAVAEVIRYAAPGNESTEQVWHRPVAPLPTVPGYYLAAASSIVIEQIGDGTWFAGGESLDDREVLALGGLQRLVTADEILDTVRQAVTALPTLDGDGRAAVYAALDDLEDRYRGQA